MQLKGCLLMFFILFVFFQTLDIRARASAFALARAEYWSEQNIGRFSEMRLPFFNEHGEPEKLHVQHSLLYFEGDFVNLECGFYTLTPNARAAWRWNPGYVPEVPNSDAQKINHNFSPPNMRPPIELNGYNETEHMSHTANIIQWESIPKNASGTYSCYENTFGKVFFVIFVNVTDGPVFVETKPSETLVGHTASGEKIKIRSEIVPSGSRFNLTCNHGIIVIANSIIINTGNRNPNIWVLPPSEIYDKKSFFVEHEAFSMIQPSLRRRACPCLGNQKDQLVLEVRNASFYDTGLYTCIDMTNNRTISRHFVFVKDEMNKILPTTATTPNCRCGERVLTVVFGQKRVTPLGCGPTDPSVAIHISDSQGRQLATSKEPLSADATWTFNPILGFQLQSVNSWDLEGEYVCSTEDKSQQRQFRIQVIGVEVFDDNHTIKGELIEYEKFNLTCKGKAFKRIPSLTWYWKPQFPSSSSQRENQHQPTDSLSIEDIRRQWNCTQEESYDYDTDYSALIRITCEKTPVQASGTFTCKDANDNNFPLATYDLTVIKAAKPSLIGEKEKVYNDVDPSASLTLECIEKGSIPAANASWYVVQEDAFSKGNNKGIEERIPITASNEMYQIRIMEHNHSILTVTKAENSSSFICEYENAMGVARKRFVVQVRSAPLSKFIVVGVPIALLLLVGLPLVTLLVIHLRRKKHRSRFQQSLTHLLEGNLSQINPDTPLNSQVEVLPYESKWEFPEDSLFIEKQIGSGHFGRVVKARAIGINPSASAPSETEVAVKMVKSRSDLIELKSLVSELKILVHLGSHLNVVNLLGAVTKNIQKGSLMVIVEYCSNGNLKDFLIKNRNAFVSELHAHGNLDPAILQKDNALDSSSPRLVEAMSETKDTGPAHLPAAPIGSGEKSERRLHKKFSGKSGEMRSSTITTSDLIEWSFEIASGMNYLTRKKVIHGDLAARNVLLANDNVVKIADFGLARKFYQDSVYYKTGNEALPVKWMAIESIKDRVFSSKSDVWSFGVTLWELFSLGQEPYADIEPPQLLRILLTGYRLGKPEHALQMIGDVMSSCWKANPDERSTFDRYEQALGSLLDPELLAQYKMPYDRYGYITATNMNQQAGTDDQQQQQQNLCHGYLKVENSLDQIEVTHL